ncbi:hypothetical protein ACFQZE_04220 [Paenibacillus sp. GCM10027627]|uniref:hypothetical protein n=1 Tax=unclassified Paenibacillus TaxID=185978 RepID=UPI0036373C2E
MKKPGKVMLLVITLVASLLVNGTFPIHSNAANSIGSIDSFSGLSNEPIKENFKVDAILIGSQNKNQQTSVQIRVDVISLAERKEAVKLSYHLSRLSDDGTAMLDTASEVLFTKKLQAAKKEQQIITLPSLKDGQYDFKIKASSLEQNGDVAANTKSLLFTLAEADVKEGWVKPAATSLQAPPVDVEDISVAGKLKSKEVKTSSATGKITFSGRFTMDMPGAPNSGLKNTGIVLSYLRPNAPETDWQPFLYYEGDFATSGGTSSQAGYWSITVTPPAEPVAMYKIEAYSYSNYLPGYLGYISVAKVNESDSRANYRFSVPIPATPSGGNIGTVKVPSGTHVANAFSILQDAIQTRQLMEDAGKPPTVIIINYSIDNLEGSRFIHATPTRSANIYLNKNAVGTSTIAHEIAHMAMYQLRNNSMPGTGCPNPHYVNQITNNICAFVEGWADFVALASKNSPIYYYENGSSKNLEPTILVYNNGVQASLSQALNVQGNVTGALWDAYDSAYDSTTDYSFTHPVTSHDNVSFPFSNIYSAMWKKGVRITIGNWATAWRELGYSMTVGRSLRNNFISDIF